LQEKWATHATEAFLLVLFALVIFQILLLYAQAGLDCNFPIYTLWVAGITGIHHCTQLLLVEMVSQELFVWAGLELMISAL
jgi:hypothetical protein